MTRVDLSPHYERFLREQVESGRFGNATEVIEEALQLMEFRQAEAADDLLGFDVDDVRAKVREALDDPRPSISADEVFRRLEEKHQRRRPGGA